MEQKPVMDKIKAHFQHYRPGRVAKADKRNEILVSTSLAVSKHRVKLGTLMHALFADLRADKKARIPGAPINRTDQQQKQGSSSAIADFLQAMRERLNYRNRRQEVGGCRSIKFKPRSDLELLEFPGYGVEKRQNRLISQNNTSVSSND